MDGRARRVVKRARIALERFVREPAKENQCADSSSKTKQQ